MNTEILPGVWQLTFGQPEQSTPVRLRHFKPAEKAIELLQEVPDCPFLPSEITWTLIPRGCVISLPLEGDEHIYGLGVQLLSFDHRNRKKTVRVNSDPQADLGDSHAPVPFYVSTRGYGVLVDTARYASFYFGTARKKQDRSDNPKSEPSQPKNERVTIEIPTAKGVDIYIFAGPEMINAIQRYNLFSGGGFVPPRWGLGFWYRCMTEFNQNEVIVRADEFRKEGIPCDVIGLEPAWQTHSYSCSFLWSDRFPDPKAFIEKIRKEYFHINLWTHAFTHVTSPIYKRLLPYSGDFEVWDGLVPDMTLPETRRIIGNYFEQEHVDKGIAGYKLDECDNSDYTQENWSFPEISTFPSGMDGEQMHSFMGISFQLTVDSIFRNRNQRTYGEVRSSHALAAPFPYVLYSDLYHHQDFIRGLANCGFSGLLWCPEVRHANSAEELIRRLQAVIFSPQALINSFYMPNLPWKQYDMEKNKAGELVENWQWLTDTCRQILELRMRLIPYLYSAFYAYFTSGIPPFRALISDYPHDPNCRKIDDQILVGDRLMVAPVLAGKSRRSVYLPDGEWIGFWNGAVYAGNSTLDMEFPIDVIPVFVKSGSILPLAKPTLHTQDPASYLLEARIYGNGALPITLFEDDSQTYDYQEGKYNELTLLWDADSRKGTEIRRGGFDFPRFQIANWTRME